MNGISPSDQQHRKSYQIPVSHIIIIRSAELNLNKNQTTESTTTGNTQ